MATYCAFDSSKYKTNVDKVNDSERPILAVVSSFKGDFHGVTTASFLVHTELKVSIVSGKEQSSSISSYIVAVEDCTRLSELRAAWIRPSDSLTSLPV